MTESTAKQNYPGSVASYDTRPVCNVSKCEKNMRRHFRHCIKCNYRSLRRQKLQE